MGELWQITNTKQLLTRKTNVVRYYFWRSVQSPESFLLKHPPCCRVTEQGNKVPAVKNPPRTWQLLIASDLVSTRSNDSLENIIKKYFLYRIFLYSYNMTNMENWHIYGESNINNFLKYILMLLQILYYRNRLLHSQIKLWFFT